MLLFPYAKDIEYEDGSLSFTIQFMDKVKSTEISINIGLDDDLSNMIEKLLEAKGDAYEG